LWLIKFLKVMGMSKRTKLELTWIGKESRPRLEPRVLLEDPALSHRAAHRATHQDIFDNRLIFLDRFLAHRNCQNMMQRELYEQ